MNRALAISKRQAQTLLRAAEAERGIVEVKIGSTVFRLIPACHAQENLPIDSGKDGDLDAELAAFEAKHDNG